MGRVCGMLGTDTWNGETFHLGGESKSREDFAVYIECDQD